MALISSRALDIILKFGVVSPLLNGLPDGWWKEHPVYGFN